MREPREGKLSCTVLRREGARKGSDLSVSSGNVTDEVIAQYIQNQDIEENMKGDNFEIGRL